MYDEVIEGITAEIDRELMSLRKVDFGSDEYNRIQDQIGYWYNQLSAITKLRQTDEKLDFETKKMLSDEKVLLDRQMRDFDIKMVEISSNEKVRLSEIEAAKTEDTERVEREKKARKFDIIKVIAEIGAKFGLEMMGNAHQTKLAMTGYKFEETGVLTSYTLKEVLKRKK